MEKNSKLTVVTHDGLFHADEVFAVAFISTVYGIDPNIIRTRDQSELASYLANDNIFVVDVGKEHKPIMRNFDHHHLELPLSSFGLVFLYLMQEDISDGIFMDDDAMVWFENKLVKPIDDYDNNVDNVIYKAQDLGVLTFQNVLSSYNTEDATHDGHQSYMFGKAVELAKTIIARFINRANKRSEAMREYESFARHHNDYVEMPFYIPFWLEFASKYRRKIGVFKEKDTYVVQIVDRELSLAEHSVNRIFIHNSKHLAKYKTEEDAVLCIKLTLNK